MKMQSEKIEYEDGKISDIRKNKKYEKSNNYFVFTQCSKKRLKNSA